MTIPLEKKVKTNSLAILMYEAIQCIENDLGYAASHLVKPIIQYIGKEYDTFEDQVQFCLDQMTYFGWYMSRNPEDIAKNVAEFFDITEVADQDSKRVNTIIIQHIGRIDDDRLYNFNIIVMNEFLRELSRVVEAFEYDN